MQSFHIEPPAAARLRRGGLAALAAGLALLALAAATMLPKAAADVGAA